MFKIGTTKIETRAIMAPMSGCTDYPFRTLVKSYGCKCGFFEMLDASAAIHSHKKTAKMLMDNKKDFPLGVQILGADPAMVLEAAEIILSQVKPLLVDLNCACPAKKVIKKKAGAYFLKEPKKAGKIIKKLSSTLSLPITVKIRAAWDERLPSGGLTLARIAQDNGAKAIFMHGRTMRQGYEGCVDYQTIEEVKQALDVPVIGSGDVWNAQKADEMIMRTHCDAVLVARGALGRPWIFKEIEAHFKNKKVPAAPSFAHTKRIAKRHLTLYLKWRNTKIKYAIGHMRKIAMWYFRGKPYAARARDAITHAKTFEELIRVLDRIV